MLNKQLRVTDRIAVDVLNMNSGKNASQMTQVV